MKSKRIQKAIESAKKALLEKRAYFTMESNDLVNELMELNIDHSEEVWPLLLELFKEIKPQNDMGTDLQETPDTHRYVFSWDSQILNGNAILKFALNGGHFYFISLRNFSK